MLSPATLRLAHALRLSRPTPLLALRQASTEGSPPPSGPAPVGSDPKPLGEWKKWNVHWGKKKKQHFDSNILPYDPEDKQWLTTLVPDVKRDLWDHVTPWSRAKYKACKAKFFDHQLALVKTSTVQLSRDEWNALSDEEKADKIKLDEAVKVQLWEDKLPEREVNELRAFEVARKEKYRKNKEGSLRREENKRIRAEREQRMHTAQGEKEEAAEVEQVKAAEPVEAAQEEEARVGELVVENPTEPQTGPEVESEFGAGIPLPPRRGRLRRG